VALIASLVSANSACGNMCSCHSAWRLPVCSIRPVIGRALWQVASGFAAGGQKESRDYCFHPEIRRQVPRPNAMTHLSRRRLLRGCGASSSFRVRT
jgi:hypothetical protein